MQTQNEVHFGNGEFDYVLNELDKSMLINAWKSINQTNMWEFVKDHDGPFMFSTDSRLDIIMDKMTELGFTSHSGFSFAFTLRQIQYLATHGEPIFRQRYIENSIKNILPPQPPSQ